MKVSSSVLAGSVSRDDDLVATATQALLERTDVTGADIGQFLGGLYDAGLVWVHFPPGLGGMGVARSSQAVADGMLRAAGAPSGFASNAIGYGMAAPTLCAHADKQLAARLLRPLATNEHIWCQLFSEPSAGSDLAGLATSAIRDGQDWVVNGQKIWTSLAHRARWALLLARSDPDAPKHQGLTYFILDMASPGVDVRPLRQMTGEAEFNEVFLSNVRIPDSHRLGAVGAGWQVAMTTLMNERLAIGGHLGGLEGLRLVLSLWSSQPKTHSSSLRLKVSRVWADAQAHHLTAERERHAASGEDPGPRDSISKLYGAELNQRLFELAMQLLGPAATLYDTYSTSPEAGGFPHSIQRQFLRSRANTIEGGTSDVLRNIVGERVLGLPKEPRADADRPWREVPRG